MNRKTTKRGRAGVAHWSHKPEDDGSSPSSATKILGVDVGIEWAWSFYDGTQYESSNVLKSNKILEYGQKLKEVLLLYRPDVVVTAKPTRYHAVIASQSKKLGLLEYFCQKYGIEYKEYVDSHCKSVVLRKGRANKKDIMSFFDESSEHIADAKMFIKTYLNEKNTIS